MQLEVAAARGQHKRAGNRGSENDLLVDQPLDVLDDRIAVIARLAQRRVRVGAHHHRIRPVDAGEAQLAERLRDRVGIMRRVAGQRRHFVAGPLPDAFDAGGGVALEDRAVFRKCDQLRRVFQRLPVRIVRAAVDVVDRVPLQIERHPQFDQRLDFALPRDNAGARRRQVLQMSGADCRQHATARPFDIDDPPSGQVAFQSALRFFFDLSPRAVRDWGKLAVQVIHRAILLSVSRCRASHRARARYQVKGLSQRGRKRQVPPQFQPVSRYRGTKPTAQKTGSRLQPG